MCFKDSILFQQAATNEQESKNEVLTLYVRCMCALTALYGCRTTAPALSFNRSCKEETKKGNGITRDVRRMRIPLSSKEGDQGGEAAACRAAGAVNERVNVVS